MIENFVFVSGLPFEGEGAGDDIPVVFEKDDNTKLRWKVNKRCE